MDPGTVITVDVRTVSVEKQCNGSPTQEIDFCVGAQLVCDCPVLAANARPTRYLTRPGKVITANGGALARPLRVGRSKGVRTAGWR
jgi:hypothetical protein